MIIILSISLNMSHRDGLFENQNIDFSKEIRPDDMSNLTASMAMYLDPDPNDLDIYCLLTASCPNNFGKKMRLFFLSTPHVCFIVKIGQKYLFNHLNKAHRQP